MKILSSDTSAPERVDLIVCDCAAKLLARGEHARIRCPKCGTVVELAPLRKEHDGTKAGIIDRLQSLKAKTERLTGVRLDFDFRRYEVKGKRG